MPKQALIDNIDKQLLFAMDFHARDDIKVLSKKIGITENEAEKRINNLINQGIIKGFHPVLNIPKLGYFYCRLCLTLQNCTAEEKADIVDFLINDPNVFWVFKTHGFYDLMIVVWTETIEQYYQFIQKVENVFGKYIKRKLESIATDVIYFQDRYILEESDGKTEEVHIKETNERTRLDLLDKRILQLLSINARFTDTELAINLKESEEKINKRINVLEKRKIIECYRPLIDHPLLGYTWYKVWLNIHKTSQEDYNKLKTYIKEHPITLYIVEGIGLAGDLDIEVMVRSNQELFDFIDTMRVKFPLMIEDYSTVVFIETLKELYLPFY